MADTIKDFVVSLGFKVDDASLKKFNQGIANATKEVMASAAAVTAVVGAMDAFVTHTAENFDKLYFATKRTGSTVNELRGFSYAIQQMGGSAEDARSAIEGLAAWQRKMPGGGAGFLVNSLGVNPEHLGDTTKEILDIIEKLKTLPTAQATNIASGVLGWSDAFTFAALNGDVTKFLSDYNKIIKESGLDTEELTGKNYEYSRQLGELKTRWGLLGDTIQGALLPAFRELNSVLNNILQLTNNIDKSKGWQVFQIASGVSAVGWETLFGGKNAAAHRYKLAEEIDNLINTGDMSNYGMGKAQGNPIMSLASLDKTHASAIIANMMRESGGNPAATNGSHYGLFQWDSERQANFAKVMGKDIHGSSYDEQMKYMMYELAHGNGGAEFMSATDPAAAARIFSTMFERHGIANETAMRGNLATQIYQTNNINVNAPGNDGNGIAGAVSKVMTAPTQTIMRGNVLN